MKTAFYCFAVAATCTFVSCGNVGKEDQATGTATEEESFPSEATKEQRIERGKYLVTIMGCHDCHTPKMKTNGVVELDTERLLSGRAAVIKLSGFDTAFTRKGEWLIFSGDLTTFAGPWGISYAANLTPDTATGIGNWSLDNFKTALRKGKYKGIESSRTLLPPMPWQNYTQIKDEDIEAIFDYLKSIPPINNRVPDAIIAQ